MLQKREVEYAKEVDDVLKLVVELVADLRAKKSISDVAAENLPGLMEALNGMDQVDDELKESRKVVLETVGYRVGSLTDAVLGVKKVEDNA